MNELAAGFWPCKVIDGFYGDNDKNITEVRINVELTDESHKGMRQTYVEQVNNKQAPYIARTCKAVGWKCETLSTIREDVAAWVKETGGESTLEIRHVPFKDKKTGEPRIWVKPNSIGRGPKPLKQTSRDNLADADQALRRALAEDAGGGSPDDDVPVIDDDLPFITCSMSYDRAVLRW
jgi:hypothetical protein